jgi:hypothetical protein
MKKKIRPGFVWMIFTIILSGCICNNVKAQNSVSPSVTYQTFYDDLSPYGTWIDYPAYGNVWEPKIDSDFRPYLTNGYWDYSNEGWMWNSNYAWGWAPFHYGRWIYDDAYGWLWIPGYEWSPAWVTWGAADGYYAWAPLMPEVNVGIAFGLWSPPALYWNVCAQNEIYNRAIYNVVEPRSVSENLVSRISVINNFGTTRIHNQFYSKGPQISEVERFTGTNIQPVSIREVNNSAAISRSTSGVSIYRPAVVHPQPRVFRRIDNNNTHPVRNNADNLNVLTEKHQQIQNVTRLPVFNAPKSAFGNANAGRHGRN